MRTPASCGGRSGILYYDADADSFPTLMGSVVPRACSPIDEEAVGLERPVSPFYGVFMTPRTGRSNLRVGCFPSEPYHMPSSRSPHIYLYNSCGYADCISTSVALLTSKEEKKVTVSQKRNFGILSRSHYCHHASCANSETGTRHSHAFYSWQYVPQILISLILGCKPVH
jgi:hypothetical protein